MRNQSDCLSRLQSLGISWDDATHLRRISMTLHRWHEMECGTDRGAIERGSRKLTPLGRKEFISDENGKPYLRHETVLGKIRHMLIPDRETGALKRLTRIMKGYPDLLPYVQGDPRGCALYVVRKSEAVYK